MSPCRESQLRRTNRIPVAGARTSKRTSGTTNVLWTTSPSAMTVGDGDEVGDDRWSGSGPADTNTKASQPDKPVPSVNRQSNDGRRRIPSVLPRVAADMMARRAARDQGQPKEKGRAPFGNPPFSKSQSPHPKSQLPRAWELEIGSWELVSVSTDNAPACTVLRPAHRGSRPAPA